MTPSSREDRAPHSPEEAPGCGNRPAPPPGREAWRAVLDALLPDDAEILARLAARGRTSRLTE